MPLLESETDNVVLLKLTELAWNQYSSQQVDSLSKNSSNNGYVFKTHNFDERFWTTSNVDYYICSFETWPNEYI